MKQRAFLPQTIGWIRLSATLAILFLFLGAGATSAVASHVCGFEPTDELDDPLIAVTPIHHGSGWTSERDLDGYGYGPAYEASVVSFNRANVPFMRRTIGENSEPDDLQDLKVLEVQRLEPSLCSWEPESLTSALTAPRPDGPGWDGAEDTSFRDLRFTRDQRVVFDDDGRAYTFVGTRYWRDVEGAFLGTPTLAFSEDGGINWTASLLPSATSEGDEVGWRLGRVQPRSFHGDMQHPPLVLLNNQSGPDDLGLVAPTIGADGLLEIPPAILLDSQGGNQEAGMGARFAVSHGDRSFVVWASRYVPPEECVLEECPPDGCPEDEEPENHCGTPTYIQEYDHSEGNLVPPRVFLGFGDKPSREYDNHSIPAIDIDSEGYLHVILGSHNWNFKYRKSLAPLDINAGWSAPEELGESGCKRCFGYTYASLIIDPADNLHVFARWNGVEAGDESGSRLSRLSYLRKRAGQPSWEPRETLVRPSQQGYSHWYQKPAIDRLGRLFLSYVHYSDCLTSDELGDYNDKYRVGEEPILVADPVTESECAPHGGRFKYRANEGGVTEQEPVVLMSDDHGDTWRLATTADFANGLLDVCAEGCAFSALQPAIGAAMPGDTIRIGPGTYPGKVTIRKSIDLEGFGQVVIDAEGAARGVKVTAGATTVLRGITILGADGKAGILNYGDLTLEKVRVTSNVGAYGAVFNVGTLTVAAGSVIEENLGLSGYSGGISNFSGTLTVRDSSIRANHGFQGGGIHNSIGTTVIEDSDLRDNRATSIGGGFSNLNYGGTVTLIDATLLGNTTDSGMYPTCFDINPSDC